MYKRTSRFCQVLAQRNEGLPAYDPWLSDYASEPDADPNPMLTRRLDEEIVRTQGSYRGSGKPKLVKRADALAARRQRLR